MVMVGIGASYGALRLFFRARDLGYRLIALATLLLAPLAAQATLTVSPLTWNVIGLDSNSPNTGPQNFPVGARVCSNVATTNVAVNFFFDTANANVNLRPGSLSSINIASIGAGSCADAYFEAQVTRTNAAYDTARRYHITATDFTGTASTPTPRELYVEHLISQSRNSITDVKVGTALANLNSVPAGGSMDLLVGNTYYIQLLGGTATQGYNQFEAFINFSNVVFQILSVDTNYSADNSPYVPNPNDKLYANACLWQNDPNDPNYRACIGGDYKAGGANVVTTYQIKIIGGGGTQQTLSTLLYDFSGSSYHYNGDFSTGARIANVIDPTTAGISKSFSPSTTSINGLSVLSITLTNPNSGVLSGYNFVDNLPANLTVASPSGATTSGCGTPTLTATAGSSTISFSNGTLAANSSCVISVNVTPSATGSLVNTTNDLFVGSIDTTHSATAALTVNNAPPPPACTPGIELARWTMDPAQGLAAPPVPSYKSSLVTTATALYTGSGASAIDTTQGNPVNSWSGTGWAASGSPSATVGPFMDFTLDTSKFTNVKVSAQAFISSGNWAAPANNFLDIFTSANGGAFGAAILNWNLPKGSWNTIPGAPVAASSTGSATTTFRFSAVGAKTLADPMYLDNIVFTGCGVPAFPTIAKAFAPNSIAVGAISTLTFTLVNNNGIALTGATFNDNLPAGVQVAATPAASTFCGGTWTPAAGNTTLTFSGGTIPANGSCTLSVNVTATTAGPHTNVSGFLTTTESGQNPNSVATATLTAVSPPQIAKEFAPNPIIPGGTSTLTFTITNPNQNDVLSGVAFGDTFPTSPGAMVVATTPNATTSGCGAPTFAPAAGAGSISFSGGTLAPGGVCFVRVDVTAPVVGTYNNTSGNVSHTINAQTINGNTASGSLTVNPAHPSIGLLKEVGASASGPWMPFLDVNLPNSVYYHFTIENTGDVPLSPVTLTDNTLTVSPVCAPPATLPVAVAANDNHIYECTVGPVTANSGSHTNTATAAGTFNSAPVNDTSSAVYATTGLTLAKSATESSFTLPGDTLHYSYLVTNNGFAPLQGPVSVSDDKATVTCPAVTTVGDLDNYLDPGEAITCTATYIVTPGDVSAASVTNTATATVDSVSSNTASKTVPISTSADVSIDKTLTTASPYLTGQTISYTLTVANAGPSTATNIQVTDTPTNLTITNVSGSGCSALPCTIASLASGANTTINVTATINTAGAFDNSATVTAAQPDPDTSNNTDNTNNGGTAVDSADVSVVKTFITSAPYHHGDSIQMNLHVANAGPSTATNVVVKDAPIGMTVQSMTGCSNYVFNPSPFPGYGTCSLASLAPGSSVDITVTATIDAPGAFQNNASVTADQNDPDTSNNSSQLNAVATTQADISVVKAITTPGPYYPGETITYTLTVHNNGASASTQLTVTDTPTNMTILTASSNDNAGNHHCDSFPCTFGSPLANTHTVIITVTATINSAGPFSNTASVSGNDFDPDTSNNSSTAGATAVPAADVSIVKAITTPGPYYVGQSIAYTLTIGNAGPSTATNVAVTDTPSNLTITNVSGSGCAALPCTIASLASGANTVVTVTATVNATGAFSNTATANGAEPDPNTSNNTSTAGGTAAPSADVSIVKAITTAGPFHAGQSIAYTLTIGNAGPSTATSITVTDTPSNLTITNVSGSGCAALPCTIGSLASGANTVITVTATINASGAFSNTATATGAEFDPNTSNNTSTAGGTAAPSADVAVVKMLTTAGPYSVGQSVSYTIVVANAGPSTATNIQVVDTPSNLTITNVSGGGCAALPCTIASLASGASATINVTATINAAGAFDNAATATATEFDPNTVNNTDNTGNGGNTSAPQLTVTKTASPTPFVVGVPASYTITVTNTGSVTTSGSISIADNLPTGITLTGISGANWNCSGTSALACAFSGTLAASASTTLTLNVAISAAATTGDNTATASGGGDLSCPVAAHCIGTVSVGVVAPNLSTTKSGTLDNTIVAPNNQSNPGDRINYTITVSNSGNGPANGVNVTDPKLPSLSCTIGATATAIPATIPAASALICTGSYTLTGADISNASVTNTATVVGQNACTTPSPNCSATHVTPLGVSPQLTLTKTATPNPFVVGQPASYVITVTNGGAVATTGSISVADNLPSGITLANATGANWICTGTANLSCVFAGVLNASGSTTLTLNVNVGAAATTGNNTATVSGGGDPACPAASQCSSTVNVSIAGANTPAVPAPINARWALWLLTLALLASAAKAAERRRRRSR